MNSNLLEDAELAYDKLANLEVQLVKDTEDLFKRQVDYLRSIDQLHSRRPNMARVNLEIKKFSTLIDSSSSLVDEVCSKFSRIDLAKSRLDNCIAKISDIHDLRSCKTGVIRAIERGNYEEAAVHIKRYLAIDQTDLLRTVAILCGQDLDPSKPAELTQLDKGDAYYVMSTKTMNEMMIELDGARSRLVQLCQDQFTRAIGQADTRNVDRFFKIFPLIGEHKDGLMRYAEYMKRNVVTKEISETLQATNKNQAEKLGALYEAVARMIDSHQPLIETYYGPGHMNIVISVLLKECDRLSRKILEEFRDARKLQHVTKSIQRASNPSLATMNQHQHQQQQGASNSNMTSSSSSSDISGSNQSSSVGGAPSGAQQATQQPFMSVGPSCSLPPELDPRNIDSILNEMSIIISRSEVYLNFLVQRLEEEVKYRTDNEQERQSALIEIYKLMTIECEVNYLIQEIGGIYVLLERFYLEESSRIAIQTDEIDSKSFNYPVSSMLDDIFFIIKKCTRRAISTRSNEVFCAIINHCVHELDSTFCQFLEDKLKRQQYYSTAFLGKNLDLSQAYSALQTTGSRYLQSSNEIELAKGQFFSSLNNLDRASDYIHTLQELLEADVKKLRSPRLVLLLPENKQSSQMEKSRTCLHELAQLTVKFASIIKSTLYQLFNVTLKNRIKSELRTIMNENPYISKEICNNDDEIIRLARDLLVIVDKSLQTNLTPENYSKLISITGFSIAYQLKNAQDGTPNN